MSKTILLLVLILSACCEEGFAQAKRKPQKSRLSPELAALIVSKGRSYGIDFLLLAELIRQESSFRTGARSPAGAMGLMQFIPATAARFGVNNPYDPEQAVDGACRYILYLMNRFDGRLDLVLAGYNAGEEAVEKYGRRIPPYRETILYVRSILLAYHRARDLADAAERGDFTGIGRRPLTNSEIRKRLDILEAGIGRSSRVREAGSAF